MKKYQQLTSIQRGEIQAYLAAGAGKKEIAKAIGVHYSTVYREIKRNGTKRSYNAELAEQKTRQRWQRMHRRRKYKGDLRRLVRHYILEDWSPQQIVGYLRTHTIYRISHETIYKELRDDKANGGELVKHARHKLVTKRLGVFVYFARPFHAWEKGAVENFNGLLRQYIPKRQNLETVTEQQVKSYQYKINNRPRAKLNFDSPKLAFFRNVHNFASVT